MLDLFARALLFWLALFELIAGWWRWWGLSWLGPASSRGLLLPLLAVLRGRRASVGRLAASLALALPAALLIQIAAASLRNPQLNPLLRLRPGRYDHYMIERLDIPVREGHSPALMSFHAVAPLPSSACCTARAAIRHHMHGGWSIRWSSVGWHCC